jgi:hypothetical protein
MVSASIIIEDSVAVERNTLRGFCRVRLPSGMVLHDVAIHSKGVAAWVSPPSKAMVGRDGTQLKDVAGKPLWSPCVTFASKELHERFSTGILDALRLVHPEVLG